MILYYLKKHQMDNIFSLSCNPQMMAETLGGKKSEFYDLGEILTKGPI